MRPSRLRTARSGSLRPANSPRPADSPRPHTGRIASIAVAITTLLVVATGCSLTGSDSETLTPSGTGLYSELATYPDIPVIENVQYGVASDGTPLMLDVCLPATVVDTDDSTTDDSTTDDSTTDDSATDDGASDDTSTDDDSATGSGDTNDSSDGSDNSVDPTTAATPNPTATADTDTDTDTDTSVALKPRAAIVSVHGGSWARGDKSNVNWRSVCQWLASEGYVAVSVNYRLAPASIFPSAITDIRKAVRWLRDADVVEKYSINPDLIGAFGGSAGGNLVSLLGTEGTGDLDRGSRVAAVAELSGPTDLTENGRDLGILSDEFEQVQLQYLGCGNLADCPRARTASPLYDVDDTDPPFFVGHSIDERIPIEQSEAFVEELRDEGIDTTFVTVDGTLHSIAMLNAEMRDRIADFFAAKLVTEIPGVVP